MQNYIGIDQYGQTYHNLGQHPRKELQNRLSVQHVEKMYQDKKDGSTVHCGYILSGLWITLYKIERYEKKI